MPSVLGFSRPSDSASSRRAHQLAERTGAVQPVVGVAPWHGWVPDIDVAHLGPSAAQSIVGLVARPDPQGRGEGLVHFPGFDHIDSTYTGGTGGTGLGDESDGSTRHVVGLEFFSRRNASGAQSGEFDETTVAVTAGDGSTAGSCEFWRIVPSTGVWEEIPHSGDADSLEARGAYPASGDPHGVQLFDMAVVPFDGSPRTDLSATTEGGPLLIATNNYDPVYVYAVDEEPGVTDSQQNGDYEQLHSLAGGSAGLGDFIARSVELWGDRVNFFNTSENGVRYPRRLRRTAIGNADPDPANDGSGAIDLEGFSGEGLRVESLGSVLACYMEDGVAFIRRTGQSASPYIVQEVTNTRGLLSTHSLCNLGGGIHFGLFTDGWFYLTENGEFREVGLANVDGVSTHKWMDTFFNRLNMNLRARIDVRYDHRNRWIWMTLPLDEETENNEVWVYDMQGDRLFTRAISATKFGATNVQLRAAQTVDSLSGSIDDLLGSVDSYGAAFGVTQMIHGSRTGHVYVHDKDSHLEVNVISGALQSPGWDYTTVLTGHDYPQELKSAREVFVESYVYSQLSFTSTLQDESGRTSSVSLVPSASDVGSVATLVGAHRFAGAQLQHTLSGNAPFGMRSFRTDLKFEGVRKRRYA